MVPKVVKTGNGYAIEKETVGGKQRTKRTWSRNWSRVRLDYLLADADDRGYGEIGHTEDDLDLESWYNEQEYDDRIMRGPGAENERVFEPGIDPDTGLPTRTTAAFAYWTPSSSRPDTPTIYNAN